MTKYRKKPVVIEATQWFKMGDHPEVVWNAGPMTFWIETLEGGHKVTPGDFIITGVKGEHYPCKPDIFEMTYELAQPAQPVQEPVAYEYFKDWMVKEMPPMTTIGNPEWWAKRIYERFIYTAAPLPVQPERQWVGLTDEERNEIWKKEVGWGDPSHDDEDLMKAIEQALKEKNT